MLSSDSSFGSAAEIAALFSFSPTVVRWLPLAYDAVVISGAGDHPLRKSPAVALVALHATFVSRLGGASQELRCLRL